MHIMRWLIELLLHRGNDLSTFFLPNAYFFKKAVLESHQIPLWNPIQFTGIPYLADPQNFIFYLPHYLLVLLPVEPAFIILLFSHFLLAGFGTYILAQNHFKLSKLAAIFAALAFVFTPKIFSHLEAGHYTMLIAFSWLPWLFYAGFRFISKPTVKRAISLSLISWILYLNYIHILYFGLLFLHFYALYVLFTKKLKFSPQLLASRYLLFAGLFLILISPNLISQLKFAPSSTRRLITYQDVAQPSWSFKLFAQNLFFPFSLNHQQLSTERVLFPGMVIWLLATIGWLKYRAPRSLGKGWFYLFWLIFSLLFALGDRIPFFIFFYKFFPLIRWFRVTTRLWIITNLILAIFAGLGLQHLWIKKHFYAVYAFTFLCFLELGLINLKIFSKPVPTDSLPASFYQIISHTRPPFRAYCTTGCFSLQKLGQLGIYSLSGNNPIQSQQFVNQLQAAAGYSYSKYTPVLPPYQVFSHQPQPHADLMAELKVKYIASPYLLTDPGFNLVAQQDGYLLYQLK